MLEYSRYNSVMIVSGGPFISAFVACAFGVVSKNIIAKISAKIPPVLFFKSSVASGFSL